MQRTYWSISRTTRGKLPPLGRCAVGTALLLLSASAAQAQVKIGDNPITINPGSLLELESTNRGALLPRIALTDRNTWGLNGNQPVEGMVVYNSTATTGVNGLQAGLAVWKNGQWISVDETPYFHTNSNLVGNSTLANSGATGANSIAVGPNAVASAANTLAVGMGATAATTSSVALGVNANASNGGMVAIGAGAQSLAQNTIAIGGTASARLGIAIGFASNSAGNGAVAIGDATTSSAFSTVALGQSAVATNDYAVSIGRRANASNVRATSLGANSVASGIAATSVGSMATATGNYSTATGGRVYMLNGAPLDTTYTPNATFATAPDSFVDTQATGVLATANGSGARATADQSLALGALSQASQAGAVALGAGSISDRAIAPTTGTIPAGNSVITYNTTDRTLLGAVSVGNATSYRQITNVADGTEAQDAVTIRQLSSALQSFAVTPTLYFHANSSAADSLAIGAESVAVGPQTVVNGNNGVGIGNGAVVQQSATGGIAIGQAATSHMADSIALGTQSSAAAVQGVAIGAGTSVTQAGGVALGAGAIASTAAGVAGYVPPSATDSQRIAIGATTSTLAAVSVGDAANGQYRQITGVAAGTADSDAANVSQLKAVQGAVAVIDQSTVKYDTNADGTTNYNSVTMGGNNSTGPVTISNVAPGVAGTDAVNVNQLNSGIAAATAYTDARVNGLQNSIERNTKMLSGGIAASAAMAVVTPVEPGRYHVSGAVAGYNGQAGIGINLLKRSDNGQTTLHGGIGWGSGGGKAIVRVGFGFSFD
ncbi:YadA family autotransporter adhesin [Variovorax sp. AFSI2.2]|uniref:YadA family autotransporter adhesin n=1 Tax=Variovorax sp. AFSI2.2 TaxID=3384160 RepID=UPI003EBD54F0